jgi:hypothetical protein
MNIKVKESIWDKSTYTGYFKNKKARTKDPDF